MTVKGIEMKIYKLVLLVALTFSSFAHSMTEIELNDLGKTYKFIDVKSKVKNKKDLPGKKEMVVTGRAPSWVSISNFMKKIKEAGHKDVRFERDKNASRTANKRRVEPFIISFDMN